MTAQAFPATDQFPSGRAEAARDDPQKLESTVDGRPNLEKRNADVFLELEDAKLRLLDVARAVDPIKRARETVQRHPWATVGIAAGAGAVIGGSGGAVIAVGGLASSIVKLARPLINNVIPLVAPIIAAKVAGKTAAKEAAEQTGGGGGGGGGAAQATEAANAATAAAHSAARAAHAASTSAGTASTVEFRSPPTGVVGRDPTPPVSGPASTATSADERGSAFSRTSRTTP